MGAAKSQENMKLKEKVDARMDWYSKRKRSFANMEKDLIGDVPKKAPKKKQPKDAAGGGAANGDSAGSAAGGAQA